MIANKLDWDYLHKRWNYLRSHKVFQLSPSKAIFRTLIWGVHCLLGNPATIKLSRWNCCFFLPPRFRRAGSTGIFITREFYEPELIFLEKLLSPGDVFIDGGANFGIYTVVAARLVEETGHVFSFEPALESFPILEKNVKINNFTNTKLFQIGLSDREGKATFYHIDNAPNSYSLGANSQTDLSFEEITLISIDRFVVQENIERLNLIKLDVEGVEELVLRGSIIIIEKFRPIILFEISEIAISRMNLERDGAVNILHKHNYNFFSVRQDGKLIDRGFPMSGNVLAIPQEQCHKFPVANT